MRHPILKLSFGITGGIVPIMKVAFPICENNGLNSQVFNHFGSADGFIVVDGDTNQFETLLNPDKNHTHGQCQPMSALKGTAVDAVVVFEEDTPLELIQALLPDVLVKGGDWAIENIVGREVVEANGGAVKTISFLDGRSTTGTIEKILIAYK